MWSWSERGTLATSAWSVWVIASETSVTVVFVQAEIRLGVWTWWWTFHNRQNCFWYCVTVNYCFFMLFLLIFSALHSNVSASAVCVSDTVHLYFFTCCEEEEDESQSRPDLSWGVLYMTVAITSTRASVFGCTVRCRMTQEEETIYYASKTF